ncbi:MAG: hypothetical protein RIA63_15275 [Cyclobacteriaceae bacterium]
MRAITIFSILVFSIAATLDVNAQKKKPVKEEEKPTETTPPTQPEVQPPAKVATVLDHYYTKYAMASQWNDNEVAKNALYDMIILMPQNDSLIFNLAYFYYENQQFTSSTLVSQELLARNPKNLTYLELSGASFEALGIKDRALQNYETLYLLSNNTVTLYKIAFLQYELKRFEEGLTNVDILLSKSDVSTLKLGFNDTQNKPKDFAMRLGVLNLKGLLTAAKGDIPAAKKIYGDIIREAPDFQPAVTNLAELNKG